MNNRCATVALRAVGYLSLVMLMPLHLASGIAIEERLSLHGIPVSQWIVLFDGTDSQMLPASIRSDEGAFLLSAEVGELQPTTLVGAVVQLADGAMTSTTLHAFESATLSGESRELAERRRNELLRRIAGLKTDITRLESDMESVQSALRVKAGLVDVDNVYARRAELLKQIAKLRAEAK